MCGSVGGCISGPMWTRVDIKEQCPAAVQLNLHPVGSLLDVLFQIEAEIAIGSFTY